jgi:hypothetical protein
MQYDFGCFVKDELVPNAVKYFTGEAVEDEEDDYDDDEEVSLPFVSFFARTCKNIDSKRRAMRKAISTMKMRRTRRRLHLLPKAARSKASSSGHSPSFF